MNNLDFAACETTCVNVTYPFFFFQFVNEAMKFKIVEASVWEKTKKISSFLAKYTIC